MLREGGIVWEYLICLWHLSQPTIYQVLCWHPSSVRCFQLRRNSASPLCMQTQPNLKVQNCRFTDHLKSVSVFHKLISDSGQHFWPRHSLLKSYCFTSWVCPRRGCWCHASWCGRLRSPRPRCSHSWKIGLAANPGCHCLHLNFIFYFFAESFNRLFKFFCSNC